MEDGKHRLGAGDVEIRLDGRMVRLKPTFALMQALSRQWGGAKKAAEANSNMELDAMAKIVALATGNDDEDAVARSIYESGMFDVATRLDSFLTMAANGGRPLAAGGGSGEKNPPAKKPPETGQPA